VQLDLIEPGITRNGSFVPIRLRRKIHMDFARHHNMHRTMRGSNHELVGRIERRLRRDERPRANAGV